MAAIKSLRILPPFAIARLGSGATAMDNYTLETSPEAERDRPLDFRKLKGRKTFVLKEHANGEVEIADARMPEEPLQFKERDAKGKLHVRPVAPFLEVFAVVEGSDELQPLTTKLLRDNGLDVADVKWSVCVANRKVARRTELESDAVIAVAKDIGGHGWVDLDGRCDNFRDKANDKIAFGRVCFLRPNDDYPEIRLRFHPGKGLIYGPADGAAASEADLIDPHLTRYDVPKDQAIYQNPAGVADGAGWRGLDDRKANGFFNETLPPALFAIEPPAPNWLFDNVAVSRGYLDDACDGFVELKVGSGETQLRAIARICAAPPATAPDSLFVRNLADDLDQVILGPVVGDEAPEATRARALDIVRRAYETVSFMNVAVMNGNSINGRPALALDSMPEEEAADTQRALRPVMAATAVDTFAVKLLHQQAYAAMRGGAAPWFARLLRHPDQVADFTDFGRRKMPALMCGADNNYLALTWRQIDTIEKTAAAGPTTRAAAPVVLETARPLAPRNLAAHIRYAAAGNPINTLPVTAVANCCPGLEVDFRAIWRRLFKGIELREYDNLVVRLWPPPPGGATAASTVAVPADFEPAEAFEDKRSLDGEHGLAELRGRRLLRVWVPDADGKPQPIPVVAQMKGPASSDMEGMIDLTTSDNPHGVAALEWSNALARVMAYARSVPGKAVVRCDFSFGHARKKQAAAIGGENHRHVAFDLEVRPFFEDDSAVISRALARAGELTQGLCSPWQNDYRECSCYYWASARPDFVNVETDASGLSVGDNWMQRDRTGVYVADDYRDARLMMYDELFRDWEESLKFEVGGRDHPEPEAPKSGTS